MLKEPVTPNTQVPENQPSSVDDFNIKTKRSFLKNNCDDLCDVINKSKIIDKNIREQILNIEDELKDSPELANKLFAEYAKIVEGSNQNIEDLEKMYNEIFFDKQIDRDKVSYAILKKGFELLKDSLKKLKNCSEEEKNGVINDLILDLQRQKKVQESILKTLKKLCFKQNIRCKEELRSNCYSGFTNKEKNDAIKEIEEFEDEQEEKLKEDFPEDYKNMIVRFKEEKKLFAKFDSKRLKHEIEMTKWTMAYIMQ